MDNRNESTHDRLNRELSRLKYRDLSYWGGWTLLFGLFGLMGFLYLNTQTNTRYVLGVAGASQPLASETGTVIHTRVLVDGIPYDLRLRSRLVYPTEGDPVCLLAGERRFTGHTSYVLVSDHLCDDADTTGLDG